jgi:hypothetical protein
MARSCVVVSWVCSTGGHGHDTRYRDGARLQLIMHQIVPLCLCTPLTKQITFDRACHSVLIIFFLLFLSPDATLWNFGGRGARKSSRMHVAGRGSTQREREREREKVPEMSFDSAGYIQCPHLPTFMAACLRTAIYQHSRTHSRFSLTLAIHGYQSPAHAPTVPCFVHCSV